MVNAKFDILVNNAGVWDHGGSRGRQAFETIPEEMSRAILFFADDDAGFTTGTELPVDGGRVLGPHGEIRFDPVKA